jgi:hypothetical protein
VPRQVDDSSLDADLARQFTASASTSLPRAPLYSALSAGISRDPELFGLLRHAPPTQRLPVLLFACVHDLLLEDPHQELAQWYANLTPTPRPPGDRALMPTFRRFVVAHGDALRQLLATRTTQTNEVGRCAIFLPAFGLLADEVGPLGHLDVGASGGLNLLLDRYEYHFESPIGVVTTVGGPSSVVLEVSTTGPVPLPATMPVISSRCGIDQRPIDVTDDSEARWLEACVWPDQPDRFHRLVAAIGIARAAPPELLAGDAVTSLATSIERIGATAHPVVTNSWVLNYLTPDDRIAYLAELDRIGAHRDLSWIYAEAPALIPELPNGPDPVDPHRTVLSMARWRNGKRTVEHLATCHPHGFWIHWR